MVSPLEPRRAPEDCDGPSRQALPSISEAILASRPNQYHPPAPAGSSLPSPFVSSHRAYPGTEKHSSPQSIHRSSFTPRQEQISSFSESTRPPFSGRPRFPVARRATPPSKPEHPLQRTPTQVEQPRSAGGSYSRQGLLIPHPYQGDHPPLGQASFPVHASHEHPDYTRPRYEEPPATHDEPWNHREAFGRIASLSRTIFNFAEGYRALDPQQGQQPDRLPTVREISDMLANVDYLACFLGQAREVVHVSMQPDSRDGPKVGHSGSSCAEPLKPSYPVGGGVKNRRCRLASPGKCRSCSQIHTPEWRRGPDGPRTLCNACGIHYGKLERRRQLKARSISHTERRS